MDVDLEHDFESFQSIYFHLNKRLLWERSNFTSPSERVRKNIIVSMLLLKY